MQAWFKSQSFTGVSASFVAAALVCLTFVSANEQPTGTWQEAGVLSEVRSDATATELADGRVLVAGGANHDSVLGSAEILTANGDVRVVANMSTPRAGHTATRLPDGRVLVTGGLTQGGAGTATAEIFDPTAETWTTIAMGVSRAHHTATLLTDLGVVAVAGGEVAGAPSASIEIFDPRTETFHPFAAPLLRARSGQAAAALASGQVMIAGGRDSAGVLGSTEIVDVRRGWVAAGPAMISPRADATATELLDGSVLVAGGTDGARELRTAERFTPAAGRFAEVGPMAAARRGHAAVRLPRNNGVLIVGGTRAGEPLLQAEVFEPVRGVFRLSGLTLVAHGVGVASGTGREGVAVAASGTDTAVMETHRFATIRTVKPAYRAGEQVTIVGQGWLPGETVGLMLRAGSAAAFPLGAAVADEFGNIVNTEFAVPAGARVGSVVISAIGSAGEAQAAFALPGVNGVLAAGDR